MKDGKMDACVESAFLETISCEVCGEEREPNRWGVELQLSEFGDMILDGNRTYKFCSLDCFHEWIESEPVCLYEQDPTELSE